MAREALNWRRIDPELRRFARCGLSIKRQAAKLQISIPTIKKRRAFLGLVRKKDGIGKGYSHEQTTPMEQRPSGAMGDRPTCSEETRNSARASSAQISAFYNATSA